MGVCDAHLFVGECDAYLFVGVCGSRQELLGVDSSYHVDLVIYVT